MRQKALERIRNEQLDRIEKLLIALCEASGIDVEQLLGLTPQAEPVEEPQAEPVEEPQAEPVEEKRKRGR